MPIKPEHYTEKHILIVEDIYDSGNTLKKLIAIFQEFKPKSVEVAVLFKRPDKNKGIDLKFCGLDCEDFIIGYGLDFDEYGRSFPEIYQKVETKWLCTHLLKLINKIKMSYHDFSELKSIEDSCCWLFERVSGWNLPFL